MFTSWISTAGASRTFAGRNPRWFHDKDPAFSPDGRFLASVGQEDEGAIVLRIIEVESGQARLIYGTGTPPRQRGGRLGALNEPRASFGLPSPQTDSSWPHGSLKARSGSGI